MPQFPLPNPEESLEADDLRRIVERYLPAWKRACTAADMDGIVLHELAFGSSGHELLLFACAIKFAAANGKDVHVLCRKGDSSSPRKARSAMRDRIAVYRERMPGPPAKTRGKASRKRP